MNIDWFVECFRFSPREDRTYSHCIVKSPGGRKIELTESPAGRNLLVYVNGVRYEASC